MNKFLILLLIGSIGIFSCQSDENSSEKKDEINLSFHPEMDLKKEMVYEFKIESPSNNSTLHFTIDFLFEILNSKENETETKITYRNIELDGNVDTLGISLNASIPDSSSPAMIYAEPYFICLNHDFLIKFSSKMEKLSEELLTEKDSQSLSEPFNKVQFFTALPGKEVKIGDTWKSKVELKSGKGMTVTANYKLNKIEAEVAHISFEGVLDGKGEGFGHDFSMKGLVSGTAEIDVKSGLPLKSEMIQDLTLIMSGKETPMKFTINQYIK